MKAVVLAAGYATRLYPLTLDRPKALLDVAGRPIIDYIMREIYTIPTLDGVYVVTNEKFHSHFLKWADGIKNAWNVEIINDGTTNEENRRGAIGDIKFVADETRLADETLIVAGDNLFTFKLLDYYNFYKQKNADCVCAKEVTDIDALKQLAVAETDKAGKITHFAEKPAQPRSTLAVYAAYMYTAQTMTLVSEYLKEGNPKDAPGYFTEWLYKRKDVYVYVMNGECYDVGDKKMYDYVNEVFASSSEAS